MRKIILFTTSSFLLLATALQASIFYVGPNETYKSIGAAMNAIQDNDTIMVRDGTYPRNIVIRNSGLTIMAENKHKAIIGDGQQGYFSIRRNRIFTRKVQLLR